MVFVTGKGGVGKTTVAAALASAAAASGRRTILCEVGAQARGPRLWDRSEPDHGEEILLEDGLSATSVDPTRALEQWLGTIVGGAPTKLLARSNAFNYFVAAAPGARELVTMTKAWELVQERRWQKKAEGYETVIVDAPASGHAVAMLRTPGTFADIARVGPIAKQAAAVRDFVTDPKQCAVVAVGLPSELPVSETLQLEDRLRDEAGRPVTAIVANAVLPQRRFTAAEVKTVEALEDDADEGVRAAARAVRADHGRAREQARQLARLREGARAPIVTLPFVFEGELGLEDVRGLGERLARELG